jgi:hypothetical protein
LVCLALRTRHKEAGNKQKHCPLMSGSPFRFYSFFLEKEDIAKKKKPEYNHAEVHRARKREPWNWIYNLFIGLRQFLAVI